MAEHDHDESLIDKVKHAFGMGGDEDEDEREDTGRGESLHGTTARPDAAATEREDDPDRPGPAT